jgi:hypothetical protein
MSTKIMFIASFKTAIKSPSTYITENEPFLFQQNKLQTRYRDFQLQQPYPILRSHTQA